MGKIVDFQSKRKSQQPKEQPVGEQNKNDNNIIKLPKVVQLHYLTDDSGTQLNIDNIKGVILNKKDFVVYIWFAASPKSPANLYEVPYDLAMQYEDLVSAEESYKEITAACKEVYGDQT